MKDRFDQSLEQHDCPAANDWEKADTLVVKDSQPPDISLFATPGPVLVAAPPTVRDLVGETRRSPHWQVIFRHVWQGVDSIVEVFAVSEGSIDDGACPERPWLGVFRLIDGRFFVLRGTLHFGGWAGSTLAAKVCYGDFFTSLDNAKRLGLTLDEYAVLFPEEMWTG